MTSVSGVSSGASSAIQQLLQQLYQKADTDSSGGLSLTEFEAAAGSGSGSTSTASSTSQSSSLESAFNTIDSNGDGSISEDEFKAAFQKLHDQTQSALLNVQAQQQQQPSASDLFASADSDGDGSLSLSEFEASAPQGPPPGGPPPGGPPPSGSGGGSDTSSIQDLFNSIDTNGDGSVSQDEFESFLSQADGQGTSSTSSTAGTSQVSSTDDQTSKLLLDLLQKASALYSATSGSSSSQTQSVSA